MTCIRLKWAVWWQGRSAKFLRSQRASISMETVIILPLLFFLTTAGLTYWNAFNSNSRTSKVAYVVSDIMSRYSSVDDVDMALIRDVHAKMLPGDVARRRLRISSICFEDDLYRVLWSYTASGGDAIDPVPLTDKDVPTEIMPEMASQDSVILTEHEAQWSPRFLNAGLGYYTWRNRLITRPRFVKIIPHLTLNPSNICPEAPKE